MKVFSGSACLILATVLAASAAQPKDAPKDDRADLTGIWVMVAFEQNGERTDLRKGNLPVGGSLTIKDQEFKRGTVAALVGGVDEKGKFKIVSAEKRVFKVDVEYTRFSGPDDIRPNASESKHADQELWELVDKDTLRVCRAPGKKERPDSFKTKPGDGRGVVEYAREQKKEKK
jgi:uncharacterized protein (TIGR03067 family)